MTAQRDDAEPSQPLPPACRASAATNRTSHSTDLTCPQAASDWPRQLLTAERLETLSLVNYHALHAGHTREEWPFHVCARWRAAARAATSRAFRSCPASGSKPASTKWTVQPCSGAGARHRNESARPHCDRHHHSTSSSRLEPVVGFDADSTRRILPPGRLARLHPLARERVTRARRAAYGPPLQR